MYYLARDAGGAQGGFAQQEISIARGRWPSDIRRAYQALESSNLFERQAPKRSIM